MKLKDLQLLVESNAQNIKVLGDYVTKLMHMVSGSTRRDQQHYRIQE